MKSSKYPEIPVRADETVDTLLGGALSIVQPRNGYRFSVDAVLLSRFVTIRPGDVVVDLGTGSGVILLLLLHTRPVSQGFGLELQEPLASLASRNARLNGMEDRMHIVRGDLRRPPFRHACADVVVCNPPYRGARSGRLNPHPQKALARHEISATLLDILEASRALLQEKGRLAIIYPAHRLPELLLKMKNQGLEPKRLQIHHPGPEAEAKLALVEGWKGARPGLHIAPPLFGQGQENPSASLP